MEDRNYAVYGSPIKLKFNSCRQLGLSARQTTAIPSKSLVEVIKYFEKDYGIKRAPRRKRQSTESEGGLCRTILDAIDRNSFSSIRKLANDLNVSKIKSTVR